MIALDADTIESLVGRVNITGKPKKNDVEVITKSALAALTTGMASVQNAFNQIKTSASNVSRLEKAKFTAAKNIVRENAAEALYAGAPNIEGTPDSTSSALLDALPDITKMFVKLTKNIEKLDLQPQPVPMDTGSMIGDVAETALSVTPPGRGMRALKIGAGALGAGILGYGAYEALTPDEPTQPAPRIPAMSPAAPAPRGGANQNVQIKQQRATQKSESFLMRAIKPLAMLSPIGLGVAAGTALSKPMATGKAWTDKLTGFIGNSITAVESWLTSFGSWLREGASSAIGFVGEGLSQAGEFIGDVTTAVSTGGRAADMEQAIDRAGIRDPVIKAQIMAQAAHESGDFRYTEEIWGPTATQRRYEGRRDLGNVNPGDGSRYRGRGFLQTTGRANYAEASRGLGVDFVRNPELLAQPNYAAASAMLWFRKRWNRFTNWGDTRAVTRVVNGGYNGLADRQSKFQRYLRLYQSGRSVSGGAAGLVQSGREAVTGAISAGGRAISSIGGAIQTIARNGVNAVRGMGYEAAQGAVRALGVTGSNGNLPSSMLESVGVGSLKALPPAARAIRALRAAAAQQGINIGITDAYRPLADQIRLKRQKGRLAATPGRSNHGWGLAFDLSDAGRSLTRGSRAFQWLAANAPRFGIFGPLASPFEMWHWEYRGGGSNTPPTQQVPPAGPRQPQAQPVGSPAMRTPAGPIQTAAIQRRRDAQGNQQTTIVVQPGGRGSTTPGYIAPKAPPKKPAKSSTPVRDFFKHYFNAA